MSAALYPLSHLGITLGLAQALVAVWDSRRAAEAMAVQPQGALLGDGQYAAAATLPPATPARAGERGGRLADSIDYRLVLLSAMLPDVIDKPLGMVFFADSVSNGRTVGHTLLAALLVVGLAIWLYRSRHARWGIVVACGWVFHLLLDAMWLYPRTLFWPLFGWSFGRINVGSWLHDLLPRLVNNPGDFIPEVVGAVILIRFALGLIARRRVGRFITSGSAQAL